MGLPELLRVQSDCILPNKDKALYWAHPELYTDYGNLKTGRILCIIGIVLGLLYLIYIIVLISTVGLDSLGDPELMQERIREALGK